MKPSNSAIFWNKVAKKYAAKPIGNLPAYEATLDNLRGYLSQESRVLELGCGTGGTAITLAPSVKQWIGADISSEMIRIAKEKPAPPNVEFVVAEADSDIKGPDGEGAPFDVVCAFHLLHLTTDIDATIASIRHQLKPGGLFISKTVCLGDSGVLLRTLVRIVLRVVGLKTFHFLRRDALVATLTAAGFDVIGSRYFDKRSMVPYIVSKLNP